MVSIKGIQNNKKKFIITMIVIMVSATLVNYGLFGIMSGFFSTVDSIYNTVQINIISSIIIIGITIFIMFILIPKESVNNLVLELEGGAGNVPLTPEQELADMIDELDEEENNKI
jgi:hypothetical protein